MLHNRKAVRTSASGGKVGKQPVIAGGVLIVIWLASVGFSLWTLRNLPAYVPHLYDTNSLWIYISLATGWCIPAAALWGLLQNKKMLFGISIKLMCAIALVIQILVLASCALFAYLQAFLQFIPGAILLYDMYWFVGNTANEWMPFVVCLSTLVLLTLKDGVAFMIASKVFLDNPQDEE